MSNEIDSIWTLRTEGDGEGRTMRNLGVFIGTKEEVISYALTNNLHPYYDYDLQELKPIDVRGTNTSQLPLR